MNKNALGNNKRKSMMDVSEMVSHLKKKNIKFEKIRECEAEKYLKDNNNYYNVVSYKHNFLLYPSPAGRFEGMYIDLDFAYLKDMAIIDYLLRMFLFKMTTAIEHYLKVRILNIIEKIDEEDGYVTVNEFLNCDFDNDKKVHNSIFSKVGKGGYYRIFSKYDVDKDKRLEDIPVWEFIEIITFGELVKFYRLLCEKYNLKEELDYVFILLEVIKLRNACAHDSGILIDLGRKDNKYPLKYQIVEFLRQCGINKKVKLRKLSNSRISQITSTLYMFLEFVTSEGTKENMKLELNNLFYKRIIKHKEYYTNNDLLKSVYNYFDKIIETYYKIDSK